MEAQCGLFKMPFLEKNLSWATYTTQVLNPSNV